MNVERMVVLAHENAVDKGFWESPNVGEKLALIATEVQEFETAGSVQEQLEEVSDIVIRAFDLCGYLGVRLPEDCLSYWEPRGLLRVPDFALVAYRYAARTTQAHRKDKPDAVRVWLASLVRLCARFSNDYFGDGELNRAIEKKMEANRSRPHMHGARY
jgi:hypothetical protein